jgi:hypothetical protein
METPNNPTYKEGEGTKKIEHKTAKIPSTVFLCAALGSMALSLALKCIRRQHDALFVGQWAAPFLILGTYNKIVKTHGHDETDNNTCC